MTEQCNHDWIYDGTADCFKCCECYETVSAVRVAEMINDFYTAAPEPNLDKLRDLARWLDATGRISDAQAVRQAVAALREEVEK